MKDFLETGLQTLLDNYTETTTLKKVSMQYDFSMEKAEDIKDYLEYETLLVVVKELPNGILPNLSVEDRQVQYTLNFYFEVSNKKAVRSIVKDFISTQNSKFQDEIDLYGITTFTNLAEVGVQQNVGAKYYQVFNVIMNVQYVDILEVGSNKVITIDSFVLTKSTGLIDSSYTLQPIWSESPIDDENPNMFLRYIKEILTIRFLDAPTLNGTLKALLLNKTTLNSGHSITFTDGTNIVTFNAKRVTFNDTSTGNNYPILTATFERG